MGSFQTGTDHFPDEPARTFASVVGEMKLGQFSSTWPSGFTYLLNLLRFCVRGHPVILANLALAGISVLLELLAIASVMPLTLAAAGKQVPPESIWVRVFDVVGAKPTLSASLLFFCFVFALRLLTQFLNQVTSISMGKSIQADLSSQAFSKIVEEMSFKEIDSKSAGYFISLAGDETARAGSIVISFNQLIAATFLAALYFVAMFYFSLWLGIGVAAFLGVVALALRRTLTQIQGLSAKQLLEAKAAHSIFLDTLNGLRSVRALSAESFVTSRYSEIIHRYTATNFWLEVFGFTSKFFPALVLLACISAVTAAGYLSITDTSKIALVVTALACLLRFFPAAGQVLSLVVKLLTDLRAASDVTSLLRAPNVVAEGPPPAGTDSVRSIEFSQVYFAHASRPVLSGFNARIEAGRSYAVVGPSGSGKSTIFDLMLGFYEPDAGEIVIDGVPLRKRNRRQVRSRFALISQQVAILNDSVANNIRFGYPATDDDVKAACAAVCIDSYIEGLPDGYETLLNFQGSNLSGGQRQRIAIARGIVRRPDVLLLDESTTGLDQDIRDRVVDNIIRTFKSRIVIFSTHDQDVVARADETIRIPSIAIAKAIIGSELIEGRAK